MRAALAGMLFVATAMFVLGSAGPYFIGGAGFALLVESLPDALASYAAYVRYR